MSGRISESARAAADYCSRVSTETLLQRLASESELIRAIALELSQRGLPTTGWVMHDDGMLHPYVPEGEEP